MASPRATLGGLNQIFSGIYMYINKAICMEEVIRERDLALQQLLPKKSSNFAKNSYCCMNLLLIRKNFVKKLTLAAEGLFTFLSSVL